MSDKDYVVFESGGRAGYSAKLCYLYAQRRGLVNGRNLVMADTNPIFTHLSPIGAVINSNEMDSFDDFIVFPADELTRQRNPKKYGVNSVWYDKLRVNEILAERVDYLKVRIPTTFSYSNVCIRPNSESAGSKGLQMLDDVCISELVDKKAEYVVDCIGSDMWAREVQLKDGYDQYVKFLPLDHPVYEAAREIIEQAYFTKLIGLFNGIFHLQLIEGQAGVLYYVEASKRISGTALVNIPFGFNPFAHLEGYQVERIAPSQIKENTWYRYEDILEYVIRQIYD